VRRVGTIPDPFRNACSREEIMTKKSDFVPNDFRISTITDTMKESFFVISTTDAGGQGSYFAINIMTRQPDKLLKKIMA